MGFFGALDISASGLTAQRLRLDTISQNIANVNTTNTRDGTPYRRKVPVFEERVQRGVSFDGYLRSAFRGDSLGIGVRVSRIIEDTAPFKLVYEPGHPDANAEGYVRMPNVNIVQEMVNMISATRSYESNITAINSTKAMLARTLELGR